MRPSDGCCPGEHYYPARRLLLGGVAAPVSPPASTDADRARLATALCATTAVLFVASVSYIALSTLYACFCAGRRRPQRPDPEPGPAAAAEETKRALQEIPVVVVVHSHARDPEDGGWRRDEESAEKEKEKENEECAVCLAEYGSGEEVRVLPACRHGFHRECVDRWLLTRAPTCPVCRAPVVAASSEERDAKDCAAAGGAVLPAALGAT